MSTGFYFSLKGLLTFAQRRLIIRIRHALLKNWLAYATLTFIFIAVIVLVMQGFPKSANEVGDFLAGFAGALAFLWLIASFHIQSKELVMQRKELQLQREAMSKQTQEFKHLAQFSALEHVKNMMDLMLRDLDEHPLNKKKPGSVKQPSDLTAPLIKYYCDSAPMPLLKSIVESEVREDFENFKRIKKAEERFIRAYISAANFMINKGNPSSIDMSDKDFIDKYITVLRMTPYLSTHLDTVCSILDNRIIFEDIDRLINVTGLLVSPGLLSRAQGVSRLVLNDVNERVEAGKLVPAYLKHYCEEKEIK